jgi:hypothetical protein
MEKVKRPSIIQNTMFDENNLHMLNPFLRLVLKSSEFRLSDLVANFECFKKAFDIGT